MHCGCMDLKRRGSAMQESGGKRSKKGASVLAVFIASSSAVEEKGVKKEPSFMSEDMDLIDLDVLDTTNHIFEF
eukprot:10207575-Lingulodinium_polyedra.AAC.1